VVYGVHAGQNLGPHIALTVAKDKFDLVRDGISQHRQQSSGVGRVQNRLGQWQHCHHVRFAHVPSYAFG